MGTPRKKRSKMSRPKHPWKIERVTEERELQKKFGLKNKSEIWKTKSMLVSIRQQARRLLALTDEQSEKEKSELISKLNRLGMDIKGVEDMLALTVEDLLDRRLQSVVYRKGLANTPRQARQFIVHRHIYVGNKKVSIPGYMVDVKEEDGIRLEDKIKVEQSAKGRQPAPESG